MVFAYIPAPQIEDTFTAEMRVKEVGEEVIAIDLIFAASRPVGIQVVACFVAVDLLFDHGKVIFTQHVIPCGLQGGQVDIRITHQAVIIFVVMAGEVWGVAVYPVLHENCVGYLMGDNSIGDKKTAFGDNRYAVAHSLRNAKG